MAGVDIGKRVNSKTQTKNAILRLKNGSFHVLNRKKLNEKFIARIRQERNNLLDQRRDLASIELRKIAADVLQDEYSSQSSLPSSQVSISATKSNEFSLEEELMFEESIEEELLQEYEDWLEQEYNSFLSSEEPTDDAPLICPVCCTQCLRFTSNSIDCAECRVIYPFSKTIDVLRKDINTNLADHNSQCCCHPQFATVPDSRGKNSLLILCHSCLFMNALL